MPNTYYATKISPHRGKTDEGYLICSKVPVARIGYQFYLDKELGFEPSEKIKKENNGYNVYRPEEEVFSENTLSSFEGKPVTDDHPQEQVTSDNFQIYAKGNIKNVQRGDGEYKDFILADLVIWDKELINKIENGKQAVSVGYSCDYEEVDNELRQKNIICNHVAVVQEGRAGDKAIIRDNKQNKEAQMADEVKKEEKEEKEEEVVEKDKCKDEASEEEEKKEAKDSVDLSEVIQNIASRVDALEAKFEAKFGDKEKTGFDELEEEIFKKKECDEASEEVKKEETKKEEKEEVGDSVIIDFIRQVKPHVAKIKDEKQRKILTDSMCKVIKNTLMNDSKKKEEIKETVYSNFISKDSIPDEENPYDSIFNKYHGGK